MWFSSHSKGIECFFMWRFSHLLSRTTSTMHFFLLLFISLLNSLLIVVQRKTDKTIKSILNAGHWKINKKFDQIFRRTNHSLIGIVYSFEDVLCWCAFHFCHSLRTIHKNHFSTLQKKNAVKHTAGLTIRIFLGSVFCCFAFRFFIVGALWSFTAIHVEH